MAAQIASFGGHVLGPTVWTALLVGHLEGPGLSAICSKANDQSCPKKGHRVGPRIWDASVKKFNTADA